MKILIFPGFKTHSRGILQPDLGSSQVISSLLWDFPCFLCNFGSRKFNDTPRLHENFDGFHFTRKKQISKPVKKVLQPYLHKQRPQTV